MTVCTHLIELVDDQQVAQAHCPEKTMYAAKCAVEHSFR